ncbi:hypothetical protein [Streptomyces blattellae]|uniref:hypothetical protein n=1 Tax=Streptomyces blattellae TaxID=2569855 RepID=UPI001E3922B5|nr:hypothetical protein [Streptomyces blattellae]
MTRQKPSLDLPEPLREPLHTTASALRRVPGAGVVTRAAEGTLDTVGAVSPRGRRMVAYTGAGLLGVAGIVEWPIALTGAAVVWLTQPKPGGNGETGERKTTAGSSRTSSSSSTTATGRRTTSSRGGKTSTGTRKTSGGTRRTSSTRSTSSGGGKSAPKSRSTASKRASTKS